MKKTFNLLKLWILRIGMIIFVLSAFVTIFSGCASQTRTTAHEQNDEQKISITREVGEQIVLKRDPFTNQWQPEERKEWRQEIQTSEHAQQHQTRTLDTSTVHVSSFSAAGSVLSWAFGGFGAETLLGGLATVLGWLWWKVRDQRNQLIKSVEQAREVLPEDIDKQFTTLLATCQDRDLQKVVQRYTRF